MEVLFMIVFLTEGLPSHSVVNLGGALKSIGLGGPCTTDAVNDALFT